VDLFQAIQERRSVRAFTPEAVSDAMVAAMVDAARWAPSAGNCQARDFIVVKDPRVKRALSEAALHQRFIETAPVTIVVCANEGRSTPRYGQRGRALYCLLDAAAATQNLLLAVHALGLGGCWVGAFDDRRVGDALHLPAGLKPVALVPVGYPREKPGPPPRLPLNENMHLDRYGHKPV
jgi:nitroreductase